MTTVWRDRLIIAAPFLGILALMLVAPSDDGLTVCPFALCTGTACPGCGLTRAAGTLLRGDVGGALTYHPLVPLIAVQLIGGWVWFLMQRSGRLQPPRGRTVTVILSVTLAALLAVWLVRLATGSLPAV